MGRVLLALVCTLFLVSQVMAGAWTSNNFLYKPATGARGDDEKVKFDSGLNRVDSRLANEKWLNDSLYNGDLATAITAIGSAKTVLSIPAGNWPVAANLTVPANLTLKLTHGAVLTIATTKTLTINGPLDAGLYPVFSCTGTGKVTFGPGSVQAALPQWFGATGDGTTDDTAALNATVAAVPVGGVIHLIPGTYKTSGWLINKTVSLIADTPFLYGSGSQAATVKAAGSQAYVLKLQGTYTPDGGTFLHPYLRNININADNKTISDAAFVMEYCHLARLEGCSFQNANGHGIRLRAMWELRMRDFFIANCGSLDTGSAFFIDGPTPLDYTRGSSDVSIQGGIWTSNRGRWLDVSSLANIDGFWFEGNKLELDNLTILNSVNTDVLHLGAASRTMILNNTFATFGANYGKYTNLIWLGGVNDDGNNGGYGNCSNVIRGNRAYGHTGSGVINGLYLAANAPTCVEEDNVFVSDASDTCPNVNVSTYPQLINRTWRNFCTSLFPVNPLPDRELPGFLSIHKLSRGTLVRPFVADANCVNNAGTVLSLTPADIGAPPLIFSFLDLSRYVGHSATNLLVRMRVRLSAAGSVTLAANLSAAWAPVSVAGITSTSWTWVTFSIPIASITQANHFLDMYFLSIESGTPNLLIDGVEFTT
jgi:Pectate lyase superfamily protein